MKVDVSVNEIQGQMLLESIRVYLDEKEGMLAFLERCKRVPPLWAVHLDNAHWDKRITETRNEIAALKATQMRLTVDMTRLGMQIERFPKKQYEGPQGPEGVNHVTPNGPRQFVGSDRQ